MDDPARRRAPTTTILGELPMPDPNRDGQVEAFFATFAAASDRLDLDRLAELFAETFLAADPAGGAARPPAGVPARPAPAGRAVHRVVCYLNHQDLARALGTA
jgi:hypothetical protein